MSEKIQEAKKLLEKEAKKKEEKFIKEYNELCEKHNMSLDIIAQFRILHK